MRSGLFLILPRPAGQRPDQVLDEALGDALRAETLGFDRVWLSEHHGTDVGTCTSPSVLAGAIAACTDRIGIGYAVNVTPLHAPRRLAEDIAMVDHLSGGRVVAGFGAGYSPVEYGLLGADFGGRSEAARAGLEAVLCCWRDSSASGVSCHQDPHPPVVVACRTEAAIRAVAEAGHGILLLGGLERLHAGAAAYRDVVGSAGYVGAMRHVHLPADDVDATDDLLRATRWMLTRMAALAGDGAPPTDTDVCDYLAERAAVGVDSLRRDREVLAAAGVDELICWMRWGDLSGDDVRASMQRYAEVVTAGG